MALRLLSLLLYFIAVLIVVMVAALLLFGISDQPDIDPNWTMTSSDINQAKKILREGSKVRPEAFGQIELTLADLNVAGNYLLNRFSKGKANIALKDHKIRFAVTAQLPQNVIGKYVNVSFRLGHEEGGRLPVLTKFKAGKLLLPSKVAAFVIDQTIKQTSLNDYFLLATESIKAVTIDDTKITINYHPSQASLDTARDLLAYGNSTIGQTNAYQTALADIVRKHDSGWRLSLAELTKPLFTIALARSTLATAIEENRMVINTINHYVNIPKTEVVHITPYYPTFIYKRVDLAQHFIGAASITASVNSQIAEVLGEEKELKDARGGSGFSFVDLAADRAGTRFGEIAVKSPESARKLQERMATIQDYKDFMPDPRSLPEHMDEATFKKRYGKIDSEAYLKVSKEIDKLIENTTLYRQSIATH